MDIKLHKIPEHSGVYIIKCLANRRIYIGSAENLHSKFKKYEKELKTANHRVKELNEDILRYGIDNIELEVLCICDYSIVTLIEGYYIKKYTAIRLGYNRINASKNLRKVNYTYNLNNKYGMAEYQISLMMKELMLKIFDFSDSLPRNLISIKNLIDIYESGDRSEFMSDMYYWLFDIFRRLDLTTFIQDNKTGYFYEVSGNQMWNYIRWNDFESENEIDYTIKNRLCGRILNLDIMYIECPKYIGDYKDVKVSILDIDEFRKNNTIIDATYKQQYKKQEERYTAFYIL